MSTINKVMLIGNLGKDPEVKTFGNGGSMTTFTIATNEGYYDKENNWIDKVNWHNISAGGKVGERCASKIKKGMKVYVEGNLNYREYEDSDGNKKYFTEVKIFKMTPLDRQEQKQTSTKEGLIDNSIMEEEDDLPF